MRNSGRSFITIDQLYLYDFQSDYRLTISYFSHYVNYLECLKRFSLKCKKINL